MQETDSNTSLAECETQQVSITRDFDAPRELVFQAWTDPAQLVRWYAPTGCRIEFRSIDVRPGGRFHSCIHIPQGHQCWCTGTYHEIVPPERIVFSMCIADEQGNTLGPVEAGMDPDWPRETTVTVTFAEQQGKTRLTLQQSVLESLAKRTGAYPSWLNMLDRLAGLLATS